MFTPPSDPDIAPTRAVKPRTTRGARRQPPAQEIPARGPAAPREADLLRNIRVNIPAFPIGYTMRAILCMATLSGALFLAGCGIKGPLYLPQIPGDASQASPATPADNSKAAPAPTEY
jgi:predicted small lipoprotein YifL